MCPHLVPFFLHYSLHPLTLSTLTFPYFLNFFPHLLLFLMFSSTSTHPPSCPSSLPSFLFLTNRPALLCFGVQVHPPREEDSVCGGARLHHGDLPGRQSHRVRRYSLQQDRGQHVRPRQIFKNRRERELAAVMVTECLLSPQSLLAGMNRFLSLLEITFRRDPNNFRPRINKHNSIKVRTRYHDVRVQRSEVVLRFSYDSKTNIFGFSTVVSTKQNI